MEAAGMNVARMNHPVEPSGRRVLPSVECHCLYTFKFPDPRARSDASFLSVFGVVSGDLPRDMFVTVNCGPVLYFQV